MFNASKTIEQCLASIFQYADNQVETIVVDDCSTDDTLQKVKKFPCMVVPLADRGGPGRARTEGAKAAQGELLLFLDSDVILNNNVFTVIREKFYDQPNLGSLQGWYTRESYFHDNVATIYKDLYYDFFFGRIGSGYVTTVSSHCLVVRKEAFEAVKGFDSQVHRAIEDGDFGFRFASAGYSIFLDRSLSVTHLKRYTLRSLLLTDFRYAFDKAKLLLRNLGRGIITEHGGFNVMLNSGRSMLNLMGAIALSLPLTALGLVLLIFPFPLNLGMAFLAIGVVGFYALLSPLLVHIARLKGVGSMLAASPVIFLDCLTMMVGILLAVADFTLHGNRY